MLHGLNSWLRNSRSRHGTSHSCSPSPPTMPWAAPWQWGLLSFLGKIGAQKVGQVDTKQNVGHIGRDLLWKKKRKYSPFFYLWRSYLNKPEPSGVRGREKNQFLIVFLIQISLIYLKLISTCIMRANPYTSQKKKYLYISSFFNRWRGLQRPTAGQSEENECCEVPNPNWYICSVPSTAKTQGNNRNKTEDTCCSRVSPRHDRRNTPMDSQQSGFLNKNSIMTPVGMATKTGKIPHIPILVSLNFHID